MLWLIALAILIVAGLGWYAWSLTRQVKTLAHQRAQADVMRFGHSHFD